MPFLILFVIFALVWPYLMASLFEWGFHPADWGWYTRLALALTYCFFGVLALRSLDAMKRGYYGTQKNRKNDEWR